MGAAVAFCILQMINRTMQFPGTTSSSLRWTTTETWTFERQFNVSASTLAQTNVDLLMTGVDTIAAIYVDGVSVANTSSIHR